MSGLDDALALVDRDRLIALTSAIVDIASPTGGEEPLARYLASTLADLPVDAAVQPVAPGAANAWAKAAGPEAGGRSLLLYAPVDTVTAGNAAEDVPWAASEMSASMQPTAGIEHGWVVGLGAHNPKGHAACVLMALEAIVNAGAVDELDGSLLAGFGCLGMPVNRRSPELADGHGAGCAALVEQLQPSAAVIAKSGWAVSWSEVGLAWFTVDVRGTHTYVGSRHLIPYRSAIADAAHIVRELEAWFPVWADEYGDDINTPQGIVASISGGHDRATAFTPDVCSFTVDLRLVPDLDPEVAERVFIQQVEKAAAGIGAEVTVTRTVTVPGAATAPDEPIIRSAIDAWETQSGRSHAPILGLSGATDANILRGAGIPTARVGLPKVSAPGVDVGFEYGMNAVNPDDQVELSKQLIRTVFNYLGPRS